MKIDKFGIILLITILPLFLLVVTSNGLAEGKIVLTGQYVARGIVQEITTIQSTPVVLVLVNGVEYISDSPDFIGELSQSLGCSIYIQGIRDFNGGDKRYIDQFNVSCFTKE